MGVVLHLVATDATDREVARFRMGEIPAADRRCRVHSVALGQVDSGLIVYVQQVPENRLFRMVRTGWVARRGADSAIPFFNEVLAAQVFVAPEAPVGTRPFVQV